MVAIYVIGGHQSGLNVFGVETPLFQFKPSVFAVRILNILIINASWDWMCAARCGFSYPTNSRIDAATGLMHVGEFRRRTRVRHPILNRLSKPCVLLFQPIPLELQGGESLSTDCAKPDEGVVERARRTDTVSLFRQFSTRSILLSTEKGVVIEFDAVTQKESCSVRELVSQAYELQIESVKSDVYFGDSAQVLKSEERRNALVRSNQRAIHRARSMTPEQTRQAWAARWEFLEE
jgi:hypothetical protein